jgi:hypothetical protein
MRSTGPKSHQGKVKASLNATKHALTRPIDVSPWGKYLEIISDWLVAEGLSQHQAQDITKKILDYERNIEYQRKRYLDLRDDRPSYETPAELSADLWVANTLSEGLEGKTPIFEERLDKETAKFLLRVAQGRLTKARGEALKVLRNADRHLRRSALQLSKVIRIQDASDL